MHLDPIHHLPLDRTVPLRVLAVPVPRVLRLAIRALTLFLPPLLLAHFALVAPLPVLLPVLGLVRLAAVVGRLAAAAPQQPLTPGRLCSSARKTSSLRQFTHSAALPADQKTLQPAATWVVFVYSARRACAMAGTGNRQNNNYGGVQNRALIKVYYSYSQ